MGAGEGLLYAGAMLYLSNVGEISKRAQWLGLMEMLGDWRRYETFVDNLSAVTADDVQRVAQKYFQPTRRTVGWFEPKVKG